MDFVVQRASHLLGFCPPFVQMDFTNNIKSILRKLRFLDVVGGVCSERSRLHMVLRWLDAVAGARLLGIDGLVDRSKFGW
jgi:hypothetical protein